MDQFEAAHGTCPVAYAPMAMTGVPGGIVDQQKEWLSRSFLVGIAAAASFPVEVRLNDVNGVDATVHDGGIQTDWQLKGTSVPEFSTDGSTLYFDLDVRTYNLFVGERNATAYLAVVVMPDTPDKWISVSKQVLSLRHCAYWQRITGMPATSNAASVRIHLPVRQRLNVKAMTQIMQAERKRILS